MAQIDSLPRVPNGGDRISIRSSMYDLARKGAFQHSISPLGKGLQGNSIYPRHQRRLEALLSMIKHDCVQGEAKTRGQFLRDVPAGIRTVLDAANGFAAGEKLIRQIFLAEPVNGAMGAYGFGKSHFGRESGQNVRALNQIVKFDFAHGGTARMHGYNGCKGRLFGMDVLTPELRSKVMSRVRSKNTRPEVAVRRVLHAMGYRFRLHRSDLPGRPDIVLPRHNSVIFVHGCFWHRHAGCPSTRTPKSRVGFWSEKFEQNVRRDRIARRRLRESGWRVLVIWECEIAKQGRLEQTLARFLDET